MRLDDFNPFTPELPVTAHELYVSALSKVKIKEDMLLAK